MSFAAILGGMITMIGTPPNIVVAQIRERYAGAPFGMFFFTPVGLICSLAGIVFVATALIAAAISIDIANALGVSPDPFLMGVAVAASCAFLPPIGHQNNTIIRGPGGYRFGDYWRMGLPLEVLIIVVAVPSILFFWPL